jgi:hypothetical protein
MTTTTGGTTYGSISNDPGRRCENQQTNKVHTTVLRTDGANSTSTVAASYGSAATVLAANQTVDVAEAAIFTVRRARTTPSTLPTAKVTGTATRKETGAVLTLGTLVGGTGYTNGTYTNVALSGGTGYGATANITVAGGIVTACTLVRGGQWYTASDSLTCSLIGAGSNFAIPAATVGMG